MEAWERYFEKELEIVQKVRDTQVENIKKGAELINLKTINALKNIELSREVVESSDFAANYELLTRAAEELNDIAWRLLASHFVANNRQYMPPHLRAYHNITPSATLSLISPPFRVTLLRSA